MAISRPFLLALLGVALLGATVFAVQNARNDAADPAPVAQPVQQAAPATPAEPAQAEAASAEPLSVEQAVSSILEPGTPLDSARFSVDFDTQEVGGGREHDVVHVQGVFDDADKGAGISNFDVRYRSRDEVDSTKLESTRNLRVMAVDGKGYFGRGDELYAAPAQRLDNIGKLRTEMGDSAISKLPEFQLSRWLDKPKVVGVEKVDGVQATHVTGELAAGSVARDIVRVLSIGDTGGPGSVPGNTTAIAKKSVENARLDAWVGPDRIARRLKVSVAFDAPKGLREPGDTARWTGDLDVRLTNVNKPQEIAAPDVKAGAAAKGLGKENADSGVSTLSSLAMGLDAPGGVVGTTYTVMSLYRLGQSNEVAKKVLRAVANGKETVVFFRNPKALDDDATAESVAYLKDNSKKLVVFTDDVVNTERYGRLVENLGVTQAPAIVFINRRGRASLVEGYVDGPSLAQVVADAR